MDSRLLNAFHDDPFDGNYVKYDTDTQFWPNENGALELQLADTLHGILPIAPTEVVSNNLFNNSLLKEPDYSLESKHCSNTNSIMYDTYEEPSPNGMVKKRQLSSQQTIEIISVDPNGDYDSEFIGSTDEDSDDYNDGDLENNEYEETRGIVAFDEVRCFSRSTFRSRTDSSSIGDYESHSSDYDDDESDAMDFESVHSVKIDDKNCSAVLSDATDLKSNTVEEIDAFAMQLDVNTFDLAAFITQDDQVFENRHHSSTIGPVASKNINLQKCIAPTTISSDSDSDSDVIVDVETVENDDDVGADAWENVENNSSWNTTTTNQQKAEEENENEKEKEKKQTTKPIEPNFSRNFTVLPNKRQSDFLKRKLKDGINRDKNILQPTPKYNPKPKCIKRMNNLNILSNNNNVEDKTKNNSIGHAEKKLPTNIKKPEIIAPTKTNIEKQIVTLQNPKHSVITLDKNTKFIIENEEPVQIKQKSNKDLKKLNQELIEEPLPVHESIIEAPMKRKLNLEEYMKRRENPLAAATRNSETINNSKHKTIRTETSVQTTTSMPITTKLSPKRPLNKKPPQQAVTDTVISIVKSLKESQTSKRLVDPITEAKNKVLRLQELKKAQQIKIIDSTVSSKVARVTKILPLKDIVKGPYKPSQPSNDRKQSEYEEIIIVSMGCNTDITIPPNGYKIFEHKPTDGGKNSPNSLLKSNALLANISNSFQKVRSDESVKISSNSLIASIQDVVVKNSAPNNCPLESNKPQRSNLLSSNEHGENKIIMHLRKDRIRKRNFSQSTQTELQSDFPALPLPKGRLNGGDNSNSSFSRSRDRKLRKSRKYRARHNSYSSDEESSNYRSRGNHRRSISKHSRRHRSSISSSFSESDNYSKSNHRNSVYSSRSRGRSISSSGRSRSKSFDRVYRNSKSRSKSPSRSGGRRRRSGSRRRDFSGRRYERNNTASPAVEERRIVYVGRIERDTTKDILRNKFIAYGPIKQVTVHYKDTGMKYGFVTYEKSEDAFRVIDSGKNDAAINMYDISFGGRRAFCRSSYADLDNAGINTYESYVVPRPILPPKQEDSFEALLSTVKAKLNATKSSSVTNLKT